MHKNDNILNEFHIFLEDKKKLSKSTISSYFTDIYIFYDYMSKNNILNFNAITDVKASNFIKQQYTNKYKDSTVSRRITSLKLFFRFLMQKGEANINPFEFIEMPEKKIIDPDFLSASDLYKIFSFKDNSVKGIRDRAIIDLIYACGIKASELISLEIGDIDLNLSYLKCDGTKKARIIPINISACESIEKYMTFSRVKINKKDSSYIFLSMRGDPMTRQSCWKIIKNYAKTAGVDRNVGPDTIRNTFVKNLLDNGADINTMKEILAYSSVDGLSKYLSDNNKLRDAYLSAHPMA